MIVLIYILIKEGGIKVLVVIAVVAVLVALAFWALVAVGSRGRKEGDRLFIKWYEEHNEDNHSDLNLK